MRALVRLITFIEIKITRYIFSAYNRLKERLPSKGDIRSKRQILDKALEYIGEMNLTLGGLKPA